MYLCPAYLKIPLLHLSPSLGFQHKFLFVFFFLYFNTHLHICVTAVCRCCYIWSFQRSAPNRVSSVTLFILFLLEEFNSLKFAKVLKTIGKTQQKTSRYMRLVSPDLQRTRTDCLTIISVAITSNFYSQFWLTQIYDLWSFFLPFFGEIFFIFSFPYVQTFQKIA